MYLNVILYTHFFKPDDGQVNGKRFKNKQFLRLVQFLVVDTRSVGATIAVGQRVCKFVTHSDVNKIDNST